jgi:hypothetical protein
MLPTMGILHYTGKQNHDTELIVHAQLNADFRRIYKLKDAFAGSAKQYFHLPLERSLLRPSRSRQRWLHLARLVVARAIGRGTGQQMLSTYYAYTPPTLATPIHLQQLQLPQLRLFYLPVGKQWFCRYKAALFLAHREKKLS